MAESNENCPSCADNTGSAYGPLPNNPNVVVEPYTPPTEAELEFSRQFYASMKARTGHDPGEGIPVQTQATDHEPVLTPDMLRRLNTGEAVMLPDTSGLMRQPQAPAARLPRAASLRSEAPEVTPSDLIRRATNGEDVLMASQLGAPWFEPVRSERHPFHSPAEIAVRPPPPPVPISTGPRIGRGWPGSFGEDLKECQRSWLFDVEVEYEVDLGEHVEVVWGAGYKSKKEAEAIKGSDSVTEAHEGLAQVKADRAADKALRELQRSAFIEGTDFFDWEATLKGLVADELADLKLRDPCPEDCPMRHSVVGWNAEVESVTAFHISTTSDIRIIFPEGQYGAYYHPVWTMRYRLKAKYAVFAQCEFYCFGVDEF